MGFGRFFGSLMYGIGGGVAVRDHKAACFVPLTPVLLVGCVAIHGIESGSGISIHIRGFCAEGTAQVKPDQSRTFLTVAGENQSAERLVLCF